MTLDEKRARLNALTRLALATREKCEPQTLQVYLDMTAGWSVEILTQACERLGRTAQWFPKVGDITAECESVYKQAAERRETARLLNAEPPVSSARQAELFRGLADLVKAKRWPA